MNINQIINMVIRIVMRRLLNTGINKGMEMASRRGKSAKTPSEADEAQKAQGLADAKRNRQAAKIARRMGRF